MDTHPWMAFPLGRVAARWVGGCNPNGMKSLTNRPDLERAYIIKGRLESEGIAAEVINQNTSTISLCPALENEGIRSHLVNCPFCGSEETAVVDVSDINPLFEAVRSIFRGLRQKHECRHCSRAFYTSVNRSSPAFFNRTSATLSYLWPGVLSRHIIPADGWVSSFVSKPANTENFHPEGDTCRRKGS